MMPLLWALTAAAVRAHAVSASLPIDEFLRGAIRLSVGDLRSLGRGEPVAKTLDSSDSHSVAVVGLIRLNATPEFFVDRFRDITTFKSGDAVLQIGRFSSPPRMEDLAPLVWDSDDLSAFRNCRVGTCDVRLSAEAITRLQREIDWASPQRDEQAARLAKTLLVELSNAYLRGGDAALEAYRDRKREVNPRQEFLALARQSPSPMDLVPAFRAYLVGFPHATLPRVDNFLYWSKEKIGFRSVVSVTHVAIHEVPASGSLGVIIASRQVYASRYFDASLGVTATIEAEGAAEAGPFDLLYLNRSRTDELEGFWGRMKRAIVRSRSRAAMDKYLALLKSRLDLGFRTAQTR